MKFFIVGTAKTGTWLATRLFHAFEGFGHIDTVKERCLYELLVFPETLVPPGQHVLMKRTWAEIFSNSDVGGKHAAQRRAVASMDVKLIYMERNRADVIKSQTKFWAEHSEFEGNEEAMRTAAEHRYDSCVQQVEEHGDLLACRIQFERMLSEPDVVQAEVAEALGLTIKHKWSEYPSFVPQDAHGKQLGANYAMRPLGAAY
jgi:hypothetical protein